ncbi:MAG: hypothetical protein IPK87_16085 [Planctomycetes bacterium]|nr:hypothetical protein [Planctomycetota bacterium]
MANKTPLILGGTALILLLAAGALFLLFGGNAPAPQPQHTAAKPQAKGDVPPGEKPAQPAPTDTPAAHSEVEKPANQPPTDWSSKDPRRVRPPDAVPPPPSNPRPPSEGEEGENIPATWTTTDLSGQAMQVHRDLDLTLRVLHDLMR